MRTCLRRQILAVMLYFVAWQGTMLAKEMGYIKLTPEWVKTVRTRPAVRIKGDEGRLADASACRAAAYALQLHQGAGGHVHG